MENAIQRAQDTFKYFWRELSWDSRRIVPALDLTIVKAPFIQDQEGSDEPLVEYMWINEIYFDGDRVYGKLMNSPYELTNFQEGDHVDIPLEEVVDWLISSSYYGMPCGGFTIHQLRAQMTEQERQEHDEAWGIDFGDFNDIAIVFEQKEKPENLIEHPMSLNMKEKLQEFLAANPAELTNTDEFGYTLLHLDAIAGNRSSVEALLEAGADRHAKTNSGKTALDFAKQLNWETIIPLLS